MAADSREGSMLLATLLHSRLFDLAEDAKLGEITEVGTAAARFYISTPEDGGYVVWVAPQYVSPFQPEESHAS
jgi:hypothetical protein